MEAGLAAVLRHQDRPLRDGLGESLWVTRSRPQACLIPTDGRHLRYTAIATMCSEVARIVNLARRSQRWLVRESAGINRHGEGDENALHRRRSESRWPRVMRWRSVRAQRSVDRGRVGGAIEPRNPNEFRVPTLFSLAEGNTSSDAICESLAALRGRRTQACTTSSMRENREISWSPAGGW